MKKFFAILLLCLPLLAGCEFDETSTLRDLSRPYAAEYRCKVLRLGGEDLLGAFSSVRLALTEAGEFALTYEDKNGNTGSYGGTYAVEGGEIEFTVRAEGAERRHRFPYEDGTVTIDYSLGGRLLHAEFAAVG